MIMHKIATISALVAAAVLALAAPAWAVKSVQNLDLAMKAKGKNVALNVHPSVTLDATDEPFATSKAVITFDKHFVFNGKKFPSCRGGMVIGKEKKCPKKSKVGSGSATGSALGITQKLDLTAYNGPGGKSLQMLVVGNGDPLSIREVLDGKLTKNAAGQQVLTVNIPPGLQQPVGNVYATLLDFNMTVKAGTSKKPYVTMKGCKDSARVDGAFTFTDGTSQSVFATAPCPF